MIAAIIGYVGAAWAAYSFWATVGGSLGLILVVVPIFATAWLPGFIRKPLICAGVAIIALSAAYQAGSTHGAHEATSRAQRLSEQAEATRLVIASRQGRTDKDRLTRDLATERSITLKLKGLLDDARKNPHADRVCVEHDIARRLRNL